MRDVLGRIAIGLAAALLPLGLLSAWFSSVLADHDRYVDAVAPLAQDPAVQQVVVDKVTTAVVTSFDGAGAPGPCQDERDPDGSGGSGGLAGAVAHLAEPAVRAVVTGIVHGPSFTKAWVGANSAAHRQLVAVLEGDDDQVEDGCVSLDLAAVLTEAVPGLSGIGGFHVPLPGTRTPVASVDPRDLHAARVGYAVLKPLGTGLPVLWVVAVLAALVLGRRRWRTASVLGALTVLGAALLLVVLASARSSLAGASGDPEVVRALWDAVASWIRTRALLALVLGAAVTAAGVFFSVRREGAGPPPIA